MLAKQFEQKKFKIQISCDRIMSFFMHKLTEGGGRLIVHVNVIFITMMVSDTRVSGHVIIKITKVIVFRG